MANLVIDIGNTQTKLAIFNAGELLWFENVSDLNDIDLAYITAKYNVDKGIVSSVKKEEFPKAALSNLPFTVTHFANAMVRSVNNRYKTPLTLGADRLAAVAGAVAVNPGKDTLVIDAGTCITYDLVDAGRNYYGGSISPGLNMRYKAINHYTAALPLLHADAGFKSDLGDDTTSAITSGVQNGLKYEVEGFVQRYEKQYSNLNIILTGGDGIFLHTLLKNSIFAPYIKTDPYLVLRGLNAVIQVDNDQ